MKDNSILFLDLGMGAAGDMICAALYELLDDKDRRKYIDTMNSLGLSGVGIRADEAVKCGITGTHMSVLIDGAEEDEHEHHDHHDHHDHHEHHEHHHSHHSMDDISHVISHLDLPESVKENAVSIYRMIAGAESRAHNTSVDQIHFHEVGTMDAIADVAGACLLFDMIAPKHVIASYVCTGFGKVKCAHGILPVPAPATADLLKGIPTYAGSVEGELCTPTGAAIVRHFANDYGSMPVMSVSKIGYGMGKKDFETANCLRAMLGTVVEPADVVELSCNVDDMTAEDIAHAVSVFMSEGAKDAYTSSIGMKKGRPGTMITVMCSEEDCGRFTELIFKHTSTIGIRENRMRRHVLAREESTEDTVFGKVRVKTSTGYNVVRKKYEYEDISRIADKEGLSTDEVRRILNKESDDK